MKILWLKTELLHPVDKGGRIRTYQMLKELKKEHRVTYLTLDDGTAEPDARRKAAEYCHELVIVPHQTNLKFSIPFYLELFSNLVSPLPYALQKYRSAKMRSAVEQAVAADKPDLVVCDFLTPAVNLPENLNAPTLLFQHNVEAMIWRRHYETTGNKLKKRYLHLQWRRMRGFERRACQRFDWVVAVSKDDADQMRRDYRVENVSDVATGVDTDFFRPSSSVGREPLNLVFTGSMDWLPNEDAISWFTADVYPLVKREIPNVSLTVVGRNPFQSLLDLSKRDASVVVTGRVEDVRPFMERAAVFVVPIRIGGGTRLKIYEAMAMELPVVSTTIGAEGLPVANGEEIVLRDAPETFAAAIIELLQNADRAREIGRQAAKTVRERFGWAGVAQQFAADCERAIEARRKATAGQSLPNRVAEYRNV